MLAEGRVGPATLVDGAVKELRTDRQGNTVVVNGHGYYTEPSYRQRLFVAQAIVTAPVIYTTAAGTGGPLIWNGSTSFNVNILKVGYALTTASGATGALGFTGNTGQTSAPSATTAIDGSRNLFLGGPASAATAYRIGTVTNAGNFLMPFTGLLNAGTIPTAGLQWLDLDGILTVPPNSWCAVAASATLTSAVLQIAVVWEEIPV